MKATTSPPSLALRLSRYGAYTGAALVSGAASFESAEAAVICNCTPVDYTFDCTDCPDPIDINGDGQEDVNISILGGGSLSVGSYQVAAIGLNGAQILGFSTNSYVYANQFQAGDMIGPGGMGFSYGDAYSGTSAGPIAGTNLGWNNNPDGYIGVAFTDAETGATHYGYVHLVYGQDGTAQTRCICYEDQADTPIVVPEPGSLALLAMGATGLLRRRRRAEAA